MGVIRVLDPLISNKIAAGEVVERPSSVVKELLENSLDADSKNIIIRIKDAGKSEISISDDGKGMDKEDALLAFKRHATSKIRNERDLFRISSLGFRGEALASIASVSEIELVTSTGNIATRLTISQGRVKDIGPTSANKGTSIKVKNLFYNTPARLKFLKSDNVEIAHINDVVNKLALAYPFVSFTLYIDEKKSFSTSGNGNLLEVISLIYGINVCKNMNEFKASNDDFKISGFTSSLSISRSNKNAIITILNGRCVRLNSAISAIIESYKTYYSDDRFPYTIINIETDFNLVDVNVHPSKQEVRLSKEYELKELIYDTFKDLFKIRNIAPVIRNSNVSSEQVSIDINDLSIYKDINDYSFSYDNSLDIVKEDSLKKSRLIPIGQYIGKYILASDSDNLYIIDQHAAAERINYEKFTNKYNDKSNWTYSSLLVPFIVNLTSKESMILKDNLYMLKEVGITIEEFGNNSFRVSEVPTWFNEVNDDSYLNELIDSIINGDTKFNLDNLRLKVISTLACKASLKANKYLDYNSMQVLLDTLLTCSNPYTCPHGRPTTIIYSTSELDKLFKRS